MDNLAAFRSNGIIHNLDVLLHLTDLIVDGNDRWAFALRTIWVFVRFAVIIGVHDARKLSYRF